MYDLLPDNHRQPYEMHDVLETILDQENLPLSQARSFLGRFLFSGDDALRPVTQTDESVRRLAFVHAAATLGGMLAPLVIVAWIARGGDYVDGFRVLGLIV